MKTILNQNLSLKPKEREIHFHPDVQKNSKNKRSPLEKLVFIKGALENGLVSENHICIVIKPEKRIEFDSGNAGNEKSKNRYKSIFRLPANNETEAKKFAMCNRLISLLIENLEQSITTTRRDLYYQDVSLFQSQSNVDNLINNICRSLGFTNFEIGAVAAQKGLCYGDLTISQRNDHGFKRIFTKSNGSFLIPRINNETIIEIPEETKLILIIEKDAIFNLFCQHKDAINSNIILITGKGFPDSLTKMFTSLLARSIKSKDISILGLYDMDPYGLMIMKQYKNGGNNDNSCFMVNQNGNRFDCPNLKLIDYNLYPNFYNNQFDYLDLSIIDYKISMNLINEIYDLQNIQENKLYQNQLQKMMFFGKKLEIDVIKDQKSTANDMINKINELIFKTNQLDRFL